MKACINIVNLFGEKISLLVKHVNIPHDSIE
jgi:hypothetical protein